MLNASEAGTSEELQHGSKRVYSKEFNDKYNNSYNTGNYRCENKHHPESHRSSPCKRAESIPTKKKRYTPSNTTVTHQRNTEYYPYYPGHGDEGKENIPSPEKFLQDEYKYNYHALSYGTGHEDATTYIHDYQHSFPTNEKDWNKHMYGGDYYYHGVPQPYHHSSACLESDEAYGNNGSYPSSTKDCRGYSFVDHTYRDFSGVPPTDEDRERFKNKKTEYERRTTEQRVESNRNSSDSQSDEDDSSRAIKKRRGRGNRASKDGSGFIGFMGTNFPARLHDLLSHEEEISDIITWLPHGRSWIVMDKAEFLKKVAPSHFQISKFESFTRQVNGWGFKRITQGPDINSYYHELFLRGMPHLIQWMKRSTSSGSGRRKIRGDPKDEPDFYSISQMYPIPDYYGEGKVQTGRNTHRKEDNSVEDGSQTIKIEELDQSQAVPSPIQTKQHSSGLSNHKVENSSSVTSTSLSVPHHYDNTYNASSHHAPNLEKDLDYGVDPHKNAREARNSNGYYWRNSDVNSNMSDTNYHHYYYPTPSHQYSSHYETSHVCHESNDDHYADFKPSEGTIGDRESFCWDDTDYVRENHHRFNSSNNNSHSHSHEHIGHENDGFYNDCGYPHSSAVVSDDADASNGFFSPFQERKVTNNSNDRAQYLRSHEQSTCRYGIGEMEKIVPPPQPNRNTSPITIPRRRSNTIGSEKAYGHGAKDLSDPPTSWAFL